MKKRLWSFFLTLVLCLTLLPTAVFAEGETDVSINETNFPDANFRTVVKAYDTDKDENLSRAEIEAVKEIKCYHKDIRSLTGIEYFTALQTLECYSNLLTSLDISGNTALKSLDCAKNQLATLDVSRNTALKSLDCADNQLTALDISQNTALESLICAGNKLTALNVSGNATLKFLDCSTNELTELNVDQNVALNTLDCRNNRLTSLNVSLNLNLQDLNCARNQLSALDVQKNTALKSLYCGYNQLAVLDVGQNGLLESLSCNNNLLTSLNVSQNTRLNLLHCFNNHLTSLDTSNQRWLHTLSCNNNNYPITITNDRNYDLSDLPGTFDVNKASNWSGGTVSGNILTVDHDKDGVTYTYDCGNGRTANFTLTVENKVEEQFTLTPGGRYYFDLSAMDIPGTVNSNLPDSTLRYVPFTYAGTVDAYKLTSAMATTEEHAQQNKYAHSLFVADYAVTHKVNWNNLDTASLIFGKNYASGGVDYTLRAPSCGSGFTGSDDSERGTPQSNEWDAVLDKNSGYVKNWNDIYSWGQDTSSYESSFRAIRGFGSARYWGYYYTATSSDPLVGFRPVLEVLNSDTLGPDGLEAVTLDLGGGTLGNSSEEIQIIVKSSESFAAPASDGLTRPDGDTGSYSMWLGSDGKLYAPGASVPAEVTKLTVQWTAPTYTVTLNTNGGTINSGNVTEYTYGAGATLPTDVTRTGYTFKGWYYNENLTGSPVTAISNTETGNKEYWAKWEINQYTITYVLAGGTAEGNPGTYTIETGAFTLTNPTKSGYTFTGWSGTGLTGENNMTVTIPKGSTGERSYTAHWRYNGGSSGGSSSYPITVPSKTENGTVTVSPRSAEKGDSVTITVKPDSGYVLETISVTDKNGNDLKLTDKGGGKYTFTMPTSKVEIKVTFMEDNSVLNFFYDVPNDAYYYEAVKWAAENGVTGGVGNSLFAPNQPCTRAQIVTFLWRAAGSPVVNYRMPFTDVDEGAYYAEAVRWAASCGIVTGLTETTFGTDSVCTRAQAAAIIYRCAQAQGKGFTGAWMFHLPFTDVPEWAYESVAWCYMNGVTTGVSETSFAPGNDCTRAQIVTFLWRAFSK